MSTYGGAGNRYPGEYDKYAAADLERRMENLDLERRERDRERERERDREQEDNSSTIIAASTMVDKMEVDG